jgi:hypothetical protein
MSKRLVLKKDFVIPKGSVFDCIDGNKREWIEGNYETIVSINNDNAGHFIVNDDSLDDDRFEVVEE